MYYRIVKISMMITIFFCGVAFAYERDLADYEKRIEYLEKDANQIEPNRKVEEEGCAKSLISNCPLREGFFVQADLLVWTAQNHGYIFAFERVSPLVSVFDVLSAELIKGELRNIDEYWRPGFRIGLGWDTNYDNWNILATWTWYYNRSTENITATDFQFLEDPPTGQSGLIPIIVQMYDASFKKVYAKWRLNYNTIDVEAGKTYCIGSSLSLHPHLGLRSGWLYQTFVNYFDEKHPEDEDAPSSVYFHGKNSYWGIGPRLGIDGDWYLRRGFKMLGKVSTALLYGRAKENFQHYFKDEEEWAKIVDQQYEVNDVVPTLQIALGIGWGSCFRKEKIYFAADLMWEVNYWWNQFNFPQLSGYYTENFPFFSLTKKDFLSLKGITLNFDLHF